VTLTNLATAEDIRELVVGPEEGSAAAFGAAEPDVSAALSQSGEGDSILSSQAGVEAAVP